MSAVKTSTVGYPRIGGNREMKRGLESYWGGHISRAELECISGKVFDQSVCDQLDAGIELIGVGDHTLYDHVLDWVYRFGCVPTRFCPYEPSPSPEILPDVYFHMARGTDNAHALDMTKFYGTNYHNLVPELASDTCPKAAFDDFYAMVARAQEKAGKERVVPIVLGPVSFVAMARLDEGVTLDGFMDKLLPVYTELLKELAAMGVSEVQIHEPQLVLDGASELEKVYEKAFTSLSEASVRLNLVTFFNDLHESIYEWVVALPGVSAVSLDFTRGDNLANLAKFGFPKDKRLGAGVIDARSVWSDKQSAPALVGNVAEALRDCMPDVVAIQPSASLMYVPIDLEAETKIAEGIKEKLSFARQKLETVVEVASKASSDGMHAGQNGCAMDAAIQGAIEDALDETLFQRSEDFETRRPKQFTVEGGYGTTTIGSLPQTAAIRRLRTHLKSGKISQSEYEKQIDLQLSYMIGAQEALQLDVLVHGEPERTDMVEFFGMKLDGFTFTQKGWVQSYGSRYVRPPIVSGDVSRSGPMTIREFKVSQALTKKPVKGMLTGATTIINWSFPRKDISRAKQGFQIGAALREEVLDLEAAGCRVIQVDDPALREGLPLKKNNEWHAYLDWAVKSFRLTTSGVKPDTQIVTHLCYAEFEDILPAIDAMDADVLTIENSRSDDAMLKALAQYGYKRDLGAGVFDVHSPVVPPTAAMVARIKSFDKAKLAPQKLWVNPDCGLKTRAWKEVIPALANMQQAALAVRRGNA